MNTNTTLNQAQFYRLALVIAQNSGELEKDPEGISSGISKLYGKLTGVSKGTGTILNITKIACGLEKYSTIEPETKKKIIFLLQSFDRAEKLATPEHVKKHAKVIFQSTYPQYKKTKFAYFQHVWNMWIERNPKRREVYSGGVLEDIETKLEVGTHTYKAEILPDLDF